jgi:hypothetical protein
VSRRLCACGCSRSIRKSMTSMFPFDMAQKYVFASQGHPRSCAYFKHSKCPYLAAYQHVFASQGHPCSCAYFKHSKCPFLAASARLLVPRTPALVRVLQTLQLSILGGIPPARRRCPKDTRARARTSNTPNVHSRAVLQTLQLSRRQSARPRPKDTRARARTPNIQMSIRAAFAHVFAFQGYPSARASTRRSNLPTAAHAPDTVPCASSSGRIPSSKVAIASSIVFSIQPVHVFFRDCHERGSQTRLNFTHVCLASRCVRTRRR